MSNYTRLVSSSSNFDTMIRKFGVVTVMNADIYDAIDFAAASDIDGIQAAIASATAVCHLDTLKISNVTVEGPSKTITGGQYANPLIKFGKSARLEMQDALGKIEAIDALCGGVAEWTAAASHATSGARTYNGLHFGEDFNGPKTIVGESFFLDKDGNQVPVQIVFYQFLPDSIFNLTQDAEGDATVFDMNGDLLTTVVKIPNEAGQVEPHGLFYSVFAKPAN